MAITTTTLPNKNDLRLTTKSMDGKVDTPFNNVNDLTSIPFGGDVDGTVKGSRIPLAKPQEINTHPTFDDTDEDDDITDGESSESYTNVTTQNDKDNIIKNTAPLSRMERMEIWADEHVSENVRFTMRVTLALTLASLFLLCQNPDPTEQGLPSGIWIYVTAAVTSFQASPDLGSVCKKAWQRFLGTIIGGAIGLGLGAISLLIPIYTDENGNVSSTSMQWQALYLGAVQVIMSSTMVYLSCKWGFRSHYSAMLGTMTAGMALLAFYNTDADDSWKIGVFRVTNIVLGCLVGSITSLIVFPVSTKHLIETKVKSLIQTTGTAVKEVLSNTTRTENKDDPLPSYYTMALNADTVEDTAHDAYIKCIEGLHKIKGLLPLLDYDPIFKRKTQKEKQKYIEAWNIKLDRILRIQMNVIGLDNIIRSKLVGDDVLQSDLLVLIGEHVEQLFDLSRSKNERNSTAVMMLNDDLPAIRRAISMADKQRRRRIFFTVIDDPTVSTDDMIHAFTRFDDEGHANFVNLFIEKQTDTFYRMVEILILRCMRQHHLNI